MTKSEEQDIRIRALELAKDSIGHPMDSEKLIKAANEIETYIKKGLKPKS